MTEGGDLTSGLIALEIPGPNTAGSVRITSLQLRADEFSHPSQDLTSALVINGIAWIGSVNVSNQITVPSGVTVFGSAEEGADLFTASSSITGTMDWTASDPRLTFDLELTNGDVDIDLHLEFVFAGGQLRPHPEISLEFDVPSGGIVVDTGDSTYTADVVARELWIQRYFAWDGFIDFETSESTELDCSTALELEENYMRMWLVMRTTSGMVVTKEIHYYEWEEEIGLCDP